MKYNEFKPNKKSNIYIIHIHTAESATRDNYFIEGLNFRIGNSSNNL